MSDEILEIMLSPSYKAGVTLGTVTIKDRVFHKFECANCESLAAELEALRADAERYRELRRLATAWPQTVLVVNINIGHDWRTADAPEEIDSVVDAAIDATLTQEDHND